MKVVLGTGEFWACRSQACCMGRVQHLLPAGCELPPFSGKMLLLLWHHLKCLTESTATHTKQAELPCYRQLLASKATLLHASGNPFSHLCLKMFSFCLCCCVYNLSKGNKPLSGAAATPGSRPHGPSAFCHCSRQKRLPLVAPALALHGLFCSLARAF